MFVLVACLGEFSQSDTVFCGLFSRRDKAEAHARHLIDSETMTTRRWNNIPEEGDFYIFPAALDRCAFDVADALCETDKEEEFKLFPRKQN
jgi:hypothetical protein